MKEEFKKFVSSYPELASYVEDGQMTWQKFYELYDLYGDNNEVWSKYLKSNNKIGKVSDFIEKFDPDTLKEHIENAQKALDVFSELTTKTKENIKDVIKPSIERPLNKFFGD